MTVFRYQPALCTDFGTIDLPEFPPEFPVKRVKRARYNEFTGKRYYITQEYPVYKGRLGKKWLAYEKYIYDLAEADYLAGGNCSELKPTPFSEWSKR